MESVGAGLCHRPVFGGRWRICRGRPACRPVGGSRAEAYPGGHIGPPLCNGGVFGHQRKFGVKRGLANGAGQSPPPTGGAGGQAGSAPGVWLPPVKFRGEIWGVGHGHRPLRPAGGTRDGTPGASCPYGWLRRAAAIALASGAQRSVCASGCEGMGGNRSRNHPQRGHQRRTIPQSRLRRASSLCTREPWDGGCGLPRRFAPRNDSPDPLSFRGGPTGRRGNPSFLRWTMDGDAGRRGCRPLRKAQQSPRPAGAQRSVRASGREGWAEIAAKTIPKGGRRDCPGQRLAKRKARKKLLVKFSLCPMT